MSVQMLIRVDPEFKERLTKMARREGKSNSQMIREIVDNYIKERDIETYIDDLWGRIGTKLKSKGVKQKDIASKIRQVRKTK